MSCHIIKFSIRELDFNCSVCMSAMSLTGLISAVPTNSSFIGRKGCVQNVRSISQKLGVPVYTDRSKWLNLRCFLLCVKKCLANLIYYVSIFCIILFPEFLLWYLLLFPRILRTCRQFPFKVFITKNWEIEELLWIR